VGWLCCNCVWSRTSRCGRGPLTALNLRPRAKAARQRRGDPGSLGFDFRKPNQPRDPGSPCSARRPGKQAGGGWPSRNCVCLRRADAVEHRSLLSTCVPGRSRRVSDAETRGRLGSDVRRPNQPRDPGSPCCARRPGSRLGVVGVVAIASAWDEPVRSSIASRLSNCVPGRSRRVSDDGDPGSLGFGCSQTNQPRDPGSPCCARRPGKQAGGGWPSRDCVRLM
jgi:hypothetical protein